MKRLALLVFSAVLAAFQAFSQDLITTKSGEDIPAKVLEVTTTELKYKKSDNPDGPLYTLLKSEVLIVRYANGTRDVFNTDSGTDPAGSRAPVHNNLFIQGQKDATIYYKGYKDAGTGTLIVGLISPIVGLVPAIACSVTPPKEINLNYPKPDLMKETDYYNGYTQQAKKIKQGKIWNNWGIAFGVNLIAFYLIAAGQ